MRSWAALPTAVALFLAFGIAASPAQAERVDRDRDRDGDANYLALGDSVAFGTNPLVDPSNASNFIGYPDVVARLLDLNLTNASCPGEASGGFISLTGVDNVCRVYRFGIPPFNVFPPLPLHTAYTTSQLDFAVGFLEAHSRTRLVTLDIGANDLFVLQKACKGDPACIQAGLPALLDTLSANLNTIYGRIRSEAHYHHKLVGLTYYSTDYSNAAGVGIIQAVNGRVAQATLAAHGRVADGFDAFRLVAQFFGGDSCKAGLLIVKNTNPLTCDIHPSPLGRDLLAGAVVAALHEDEPD